MCVIYACSTAIPDEEELNRGAFRNDDGAGIAWLGKVNGEEKVLWKKGLKDEKDVLAFIEKKKLTPPLVIHFRTASVGSKCPELCHPFPVAEGVPLTTEGSADEVLFHNGHLSNWDDIVLRAALGMDVQVPEGEWSDSRALAWLTYLKGPGIMTFLGGSSRILTFHAAPDIWEDCEYDRAHDHFTIWGSWPTSGEKGYRQSVTTEWGGGTVIRGRGFRSAEDYYAAEEDNTDSCSAVQRYTPSSVEAVAGLNIWTVQELREVLARVEKELKDARTAAGLQAQ